MKKLKTLIFAFLILSLYSCDEAIQEHPLKETEIITTPPVSDTDTLVEKSKPSEKPENEETVKLVMNSIDKKKLSLAEDLPFGASYKQVKERFPKVEALKPEGNIAENSKRGLTEATMPVELLKRKGIIEFNFLNDSLYSFFYTIIENDFDKGEDLYDGLQNFYNNRFGQTTEEEIEEHNRFTKSCYWDTEKHKISMTWNMNSNIISWGVQAK